MTKEEFDTLTDKLQGHVKYLYFHLMGEPTLHPLVPAFISLAKQKHFTPIITTNGSLLRQNGHILLSDPPHKISISLHAPSANPTFANNNYLSECIDFAKKAADAGCYVAFRLWNLGSEDEKENTEILDRLHEAFPSPWTDMRNPSTKKLEDRIYIEFAERFDWPDENAKEQPMNADAFCYGLRDQIGILCDGTVVPCCLDSDGVIGLGNLFEHDLGSILNSKRAVNLYDGFSRRRAVEPLCRKCGYARRFSKNI